MMKEYNQNQSLDALLDDPFASPTPQVQSDSRAAKRNTYDDLTPEYQEKAQKIANQIDYKNQ
ncbi:toxic anion resistance protein, partial [Priestia megaterium]|nr:toxic anion resistance protein [Priestia megaterium]